MIFGYWLAVDVSSSRYFTEYLHAEPIFKWNSWNFEKYKFSLGSNNENLQLRNFIELLKELNSQIPNKFRLWSYRVVKIHKTISTG